MVTSDGKAIEEWKRFGKSRSLYQLYSIDPYKDSATRSAIKWRRTSPEARARVETVSHFGYPVYLVWVRDISTDRIYKEYHSSRRK